MTHWRWPLLLGLGYIVLGLLAYSPVLNAFFLADDFHFIFYAQYFGLKAVWTLFPRDFFRPLVMLSFWTDRALWGLNPLGFHVTNTLFHCANSLLVAMIAHYWLQLAGWAKDRIRWPAAFAGLLFLLHPSHTEAVSWISGRSDVIAVFWVLLSFAAYFEYCRSHCAGLLWLSWALFGFGLLTKESAVSFPLLVLVAEWYRQPGDWRSRKKWFPVMGFFAVLGGYLLLRWVALGVFLGGYGITLRPQIEDPFWLRNLIFYTSRCLIPAVDWNINPYVMPVGRVVCGILGIWLFWTIAQHIRCWIQKGNKKPRFVIPAWLLVLSGLYLIALLPVLDMMSLSVHMRAFFGERLIYWPSVFVVIILVIPVSRAVGTWRRIGMGALTVLAVLYGVSLYHANQTWREAGKISQNCADDIRALEPGGRLFVLNAPDAIQGAYLFRTGLVAITRLWDKPPRFNGVYPVMFQKIDSTEDGVTIQQTGNNTWQAQTQGKETYFIRRGPKKGNPPMYEIQEMTRNDFTVRFWDLKKEDRIVYYSEGRFVELKL